MHPFVHVTSYFPRVTLSLWQHQRNPNQANRVSFEDVLQSGFLGFFFVKVENFSIWFYPENVAFYRIADEPDKRLYTDEFWLDDAVGRRRESSYFNCCFRKIAFLSNSCVFLNEFSEFWMILIALFSKKFTLQILWVNWNHKCIDMAKVWLPNCIFQVIATSLKFLLKIFNFGTSLNNQRHHCEWRKLKTVSWRE